MTEPVTLDCGAGSVVLFSRGKPQREHDNQDAACVLQLSRSHAVLAIADGVGGQRRGADAAALTLDRLSAAVAASSADRRSGATGKAIVAGLENANRELLETRHGGASTVAVVEVAGRTVHPFHVGDSEILVVGQRGKVRLDVVPHSPVGYAVEAGILPRAQAIHHVDRHLVSNVIGSRTMEVDVGAPLRLQQRDTLLIASDGLFDNLHLEEIVELLRLASLERVGSSIVEACSRRMSRPEAGLPSKPDDLTFILFRLHA
jgi:serine/threonine protein phosphatase PrpC